ncbi:MAG: N-acetylgalactosamine-6-sulfatase [Pirellulaceae bacterium]|nr:MAG: N-acetylgalactosamine-6-sulfatase [Pirellulaceae bacterium]
MRYYPSIVWTVGAAVCWWLVFAATTTIAAAEQRHVPPNVVWIVSDDQGYGDVGCFGSSEVLTPNLDQLAARGVRLTNFYVAWPACTPSRGSLLTGRYPQRNGMYDMLRNEAPDYGYRYSPAEYAVTFERIGGMDERELLLAELLRRRGYRTAIFGKWDLGSLRRFLPTSRGFERFYGFVNTGIDYFTHERYGIPSMYRGAAPTEEDRGTYCTDLFLREAERFLAECHDEPFFLYLPFNAPHSASNLDPVIRSAPQATEHYKSLYPHLQKEAGVQQAERYGKPAQVRNRAGRRLEYCAAVTHMDAAIGRVVQLIDQYGIADRTFIFFCSDNGGSSIADNGPLRGHKAQLWEGGIRVPAMVVYPPRIPAGEVRDQFLSSLELFPTVANLCQASLPPQLVLDGYDVIDILSDDVASPREVMCWQRRDDRAVREGTWKWVDTKAGKGLYNLSEDVGEQHDLSAQRPDVVVRLQRIFAAWQREMEAAEPRGPFRDF